ncbi:MAG: TolC family protein, partial [Gemmatimonadaceae bacterium]
MLVISPASLFGQQATSPLTLIEAQAAAQRVSPELRAAREAVVAADARARQAGAFPNPTLAYSHERASRAGTTNAQHIAALEQPLDILGQRAARREAAELRAAVARAHLEAAESRLDFDVARAFAHVVATDRRATLASQASAAFGEARRVSRVRLAAGDVSGYADRRLRLEAARYAALAAQTALARDSARLVLAWLVADSTMTPAASIATALDTRQMDTMVASLVADTVGRPPAVAVVADSLRALALTRRAELRVAALERDVAAAEVRLAGRERVPVPVVTAGIKTESAAGLDGFRGLVAGLAV